jgi:tetratricopeptide (TPR) repeat protein
MIRRFLVAVTGALCGAVWQACGYPPELRTCQELVDKGSYDAGVVVCEEVFGKTGDSSAAVAVARAKLNLKQGEDALRWTARVLDGPERRMALDVAAVANLQLGRRGDAEADYRAALGLHRSAGDDARAAAAAYGLYWLAWSSSRYGEAFEHAEAALDFGRRAGNTALARRATEGLFTVLFDIGDLEGAARALDAAAALQPEMEPVDQGRFFIHRGAIQSAKGRPRLARHYYSAALAAAGTAADAKFLRTVHINLTQACLEIADLDCAKLHLEVANRHAGPEGRAPVSLLYWRGRVDLESGRPSEAVASLQAALVQEPTPEWRWRVEYEAGRAYELLGDQARAEAHHRRAVDAVEAMRTALAIDEMKSWLLDRKRRPFEALFGLYASRPQGKDAALAVFERARARSFGDAFVRGAQPEMNADGTSGTARRLASLQALLPAIPSCTNASGCTPDRLRNALRGRHVVAYLEADDRVWLIVVSQGRTRIQRLEAPARVVAELVDGLVANPDDTSHASRLADLLLPEGALPPPSVPLAVVPDGSISRLPFAALVRSGRRLVEDHPVVYTPSLTALAPLEERPRPRRTSPAELLGDPGGDLPGAAREVADLATRLGAMALTGREATQAALRAASRAPLLHVAAHTGEGATGPWLLLADGPIGPKEIVAEHLESRIVVLATCASAAPRGRSLWGSLAAAFHAAGAESVVASLWAVGDSSAREFVTRFYDNGGADDPVLAVARAQRDFIREGRPTSFWAPFVVIGSRHPTGS